MNCVRCERPNKYKVGNIICVRHTQMLSVISNPWLDVENHEAYSLTVRSWSQRDYKRLCCHCGKYAGSHRHWDGCCMNVDQGGFNNESWYLPGDRVE